MTASSRLVKVRRLALVFGLIPAIVLCSWPGPPAGPAHAHSSDDSRKTYRGLTRLSAAELERVYACGTVGSWPVGYFRGRLLVMTDYPFPRAAVVVSGLGWKGKHIGHDGGFVNQFACRRRIDSTAVIEPSWYDGKPCVAMQYAPGTPLFGNVRDEFREVAPELYLGLVYQVHPPRHIGYMCLESDPSRPSTTAPGRH
jgi:hypothetical protein